MVKLGSLRHFCVTEIVLQTAYFGKIPADRVVKKYSLSELDARKKDFSFPLVTVHYILLLKPQTIVG
jgi:hypothetical protein